MVLFKEGDKDWGNSLNAQLIKAGLASMQQDLDDEEVTPAVAEWYEIEEELKEH